MKLFSHNRTCAWLLTVFASFFMMNTALAAGLDGKIDAYLKESKAILANIASGHPNPSLIESKARDLVKQGTWFCHQYADKHPESKKLMNLTIENADSMQNLSLEKIEHLWHEGAFFNEPGHELGFDRTDEDYEHFANATDAVIHPATVVILAKMYAQSPDKKYLDQIKAELNEVNTHINYTKHDLAD